MKILHILRSEPSAMVRRLIEGTSKGESASEVPLYQGTVDYPKLVQAIFGSDRVICWW